MFFVADIIITFYDLGIWTQGAEKHREVRQITKQSEIVIRISDGGKLSIMSTARAVVYKSIPLTHHMMSEF